MEDFQDKVAVVTGAASGIGRALARHACGLGMRVVLADINASGLKDAVDALRGAGAGVSSILTDVGDADSVEALAAACQDRFGAVHLLFNNAGITTAADNVEYAWDVPLEDWTRILRVNLWGVIHGCRSFIPRMLAGGQDGHIVNTASSAGLGMGGPRGVTVYGVSKHAVVRLSEGLARQLAEQNSKVKVSVLCPAAVATGVVDSAFAGWTPRSDEQRRRASDLQGKIAAGSDPAQIAAAAFEAIRKGWLHILPHESVRSSVQQRFQAIMSALDEQHGRRAAPG